MISTPALAHEELDEGVLVAFIVTNGRIAEHSFALLVFCSAVSSSIQFAPEPAADAQFEHVVHRQFSAQTLSEM